MKNKAFLIVVLVVIGIAVFLSSGNKSQKEDVASEPVNQEVLDNLTQEFFSDLGQNLDTDYVSPIDWPPLVRALEGEIYSCTPAGNEIDRAGRTERVVMGGEEYCVTTVSEGAAGSIYKQYAYIKDVRGVPVAATFSFRFVQCLNYDEPNQSVCFAEQESFDISPLMHDFFSRI
jgi:hypothetical protein